MRPTAVGDVEKERCNQQTLVVHKYKTGNQFAYATACPDYCFYKKCDVEHYHKACACRKHSNYVALCWSGNPYAVGRFLRRVYETTGKYPKWKDVKINYDPARV